MISQNTVIHTSLKRIRLKLSSSIADRLFTTADFVCSSPIWHDATLVRPSRVAFTYNHENLDLRLLRRPSRCSNFPRRCYNLDATPAEHAVCFSNLKPLLDAQSAALVTVLHVIIDQVEPTGVCP